MKIGVLTFHRPINYGAFLQAYSLSTKLKSLDQDNDVEIIDYHLQKERKKIVINAMRIAKHYGPVNAFREILKIRSFRKSLKLLPLSQKKMKNCKLDELYEYIDKTYDLLIIGSDAIFNWNQYGYPTAFIPQYDFQHCKVATYAASVHGLKFYQESLEKIEECGHIFTKMEVVGVRDLNTENFVKYCNKELQPKHCCDPTVFIEQKDIIKNAGDYKKRISKKYKFDVNEKYIVLMLPDGEVTKSIRKEFSKEFQIVTLFKPSRDADVYLYDLNPFEWAMILSNASLVITSYFHGTLLSLRQDVPVIVIDCSKYNDNKYEGKLNDLLVRRLSLPELYFDESNISSSNIEKLFEISYKALDGDFAERIHVGMEREKVYFEKYIDLLKHRCFEEGHK